jgi:type II secretory pathway pseudopilin PulG
MLALECVQEDAIAGWDGNKLGVRQMNGTPIRRHIRPSEEGYMLVAVIFMLAILIISLTIAAPAVKTELTRDREIETMHRGMQYARAIQLYYYRKSGRYPPNADVLVKPTNGIRFLRRKYIDPTTGKDEWRPIQRGQNKAPTAMGFFGQPLGGSTLGGTGAGGVTGANSLIPPPSTSDSSAAAQNPPGQDPNSGGANPAPGSIAGSTGPTFGGAGIMGFAPTSPKQSLMTYKKKNHYNEWEFVYDPLAEQMKSGGSTGPSGSQPIPTTQPPAPSSQQ